jgi:aldehyde dehydrogenase (NAD+)
MNIYHIPNWIDGQDSSVLNDSWLQKYNPHNNEIISCFINSTKFDVDNAIIVAQRAFVCWAEESPVKRGQIITKIARLMADRKDILVNIIVSETGKSQKDALGEVNASILQADYWASEGMRLFGKSLTSSIPNKHSYTVRKPIGVCGLIVPANTSLANIAWKIFPALVCGNSVVLKASEDAPCIAYSMAKLMEEAGLPKGIVNVIQGVGSVSGNLIVNDSRVKLISFTGSTKTGRIIAEICGRRNARVSLELGGKNPFVVCDDADLDLAVHWALLSSFSNSGQRCSASSRIIVFKSVYADFRKKFIDGAKLLKMGIAKDCDFGPLINERHMLNVLNWIDIAKQEGGEILFGGGKSNSKELLNGYYVEPTIIEHLPEDSVIYKTEIFGPVVTLQSVSNLSEALSLANDSEYGLTSAIHTKSIDRGNWFAHRVNCGVANINFGTFGSEPHMPFGGIGSSGNGTREPGVEALDVYSELKNISVLINENLL